MLPQNAILVRPLLAKLYIPVLWGKMEELENVENALMGTTELTLIWRNVGFAPLVTSVKPLTLFQYVPKEHIRYEARCLALPAELVFIMTKKGLSDVRGALLGMNARQQQRPPAKQDFTPSLELGFVNPAPLDFIQINQLQLSAKSALKITVVLVPLLPPVQVDFILKKER